MLFRKKSPFFYIGNLLLELCFTYPRYLVCTTEEIFPENYKSLIQTYLLTLKMLPENFKICYV